MGNARTYWKGTKLYKQRADNRSETVIFNLHRRTNLCRSTQHFTLLKICDDVKLKFTLLNSICKKRVNSFEWSLGRRKIIH
jgi:hypothetical protein